MNKDMTHFWIWDLRQKVIKNYYLWPVTSPCQIWSWFKWPCSTVCLWRWWKCKFMGFFSKKWCFFCHWMTLIFFGHIKNENVSSLTWHNLTKFCPKWRSCSTFTTSKGMFIVVLYFWNLDYSTQIINKTIFQMLKGTNMATFLLSLF